jgi:C4-dicarboxylate-specific signal transduction histidine kinase
LTVLTVIADQMALAMENAIHLEMSRKDFIEQMHDRRLKDMGLLGSTISHQMCNRLQKITLAIEYAQSVFTEQALASDTRETLVAKLRESLADFEMMKREAFSAAEISDALKTFSKSGTEPSAVALKRVVKMAKDLVDAKHRDFAYAFVEEYDPNLTLWVNVSSIQDVLFNAFDNSLDAVKIKQKSGNCPAGYTPLISVKAYANGTMATVEVEDNGVGFRPENLEKVFIPFFTTKGTMEGTGLGLHAMRELVRRNNGDIEITSEFMQWARVTINLPLARSG